MNTQVSSGFAELFEGGFQVFDDFLGKNVRIGQVVEFFEPFVPAPKDIAAGFVRLLNKSKIGLIPFSLLALSITRIEIKESVIYTAKTTGIRQIRTLQQSQDKVQNG